jgi:hypothetical protein
MDIVKSGQIRIRTYSCSLTFDPGIPRNYQFFCSFSLAEIGCSTSIDRRILNTFVSQTVKRGVSLKTVETAAGVVAFGGGWVSRARTYSLLTGTMNAAVRDAFLAEEQQLALNLHAGHQDK